MVYLWDGMSKVRMGAPVLPQGVKDSTTANIQAKVPGTGRCQFSHAANDCRIQASELKACGQDITRLDAAIVGVTSSLCEVNSAVAEAGCQFGNSSFKFPWDAPEEEQLPWVRLRSGVFSCARMLDVTMVLAVKEGLWQAQTQSMASTEYGKHRREE